jgi:hypothetical protein
VSRDVRKDVGAARAEERADDDDVRRDGRRASGGHDRQPTESAAAKEAEEDRLGAIPGAVSGRDGGVRVARRGREHFPAREPRPLLG